ncbi:MAG: hypothetical protein K2M55_06145 [Muribaculaceae bacterium]|nr:hypothetical protein [Muribaculaceae bacterium]
MKLTQYIASAVAVAAMAFASSCTDSVKYTPTADYEGDGVYFSSEADTNIDLPENATSTTVYINRVKTADELTVNLTGVTYDIDELPVEGLFTVPATVTFAAGEAVAAIPVAVDFSKIFPGDDYYLTISTDTQTCDYGATSCTYTISYSPWKDPVRYIEDPVAVTYTWPFNGDLEFDQYLYVQDNAVNENLKRFIVPTPYAAAVPIDFTYDIDFSNPVEIDGDICYQATTPAIPFYEVDPDDLCTIMDAYSWAVMGFTEEYGPDGFTSEDIHAWLGRQGWSASYFNTRTGVIAFTMVAYPATKEWGYMYNQSQSFMYTIELPGYSNYSFMYDYQGNFVDVTGAESVLIDVFKSSNMAYFTAISKPGELTEAEIQAAADEMANDNDKQFYSENGATVVVPTEKEGMYTLVTTGYDEGYNPVYTSSYTFEFKTVQASSEWEDYGEADYTDGIICSIYGIDPITYPVKVQRHKETAGLYRVVNPYADYSKYSGYMSDMKAGNYYLYLDATDPKYVDLPASDLGISMVPADGYISVVSNAAIIIEAGNADKATLQKYGYYGTLEDGVITFPAGVLVGALSNYEGGDWSIYCNIDPENPGLTDNTIKFDPYYGQGTFELAIYNLMDEAAGAPAKKAAAQASKGAVKSIAAPTFNLGKKVRTVRTLSKEEKAQRNSMEISKTRISL